MDRNSKSKKRRKNKTRRKAQRGSEFVSKQQPRNPKKNQDIKSKILRMIDQSSLIF